MGDNQIFSFSARGEDSRIINEYLERCQKRGEQKSKVIVSAVKQKIAREEQWVRDQHIKVHIQEMGELWDKKEMEGIGGYDFIIAYLKGSEIFEGEPCPGCTKIYEDAKEKPYESEEQFEYLHKIVYPDQTEK